jgi:hypothetical protein
MYIAARDARDAEHEARKQRLDFANMCPGDTDVQDILEIGQCHACFFNLDGSVRCANTASACFCCASGIAS